MLMGGDSCLRGHEFESQHRILDEPLLIFEKTENKQKESGNVRFLKCFTHGNYIFATYDFGKPV